jgi:hypothetical protein
MPNAVYPKFKESCLSGAGNLAAGDVRAILIDTAIYSYNAAHEFLSSVPAGARVAVSGSLTGKTVTNGVFDANDVTIASVAGATVEALLLYLHTGADATAKLVSFHDHEPDGTTVIAYAPDGNNVLVAFPNDAGRIFAL